MISEFLDDIKDLFPVAIRALLFTFKRESFSRECSAGIRILTTFLVMIPDSKIVEDIHQHIKDLKRRGRCLHYAALSRARAAVVSGILERRGIQHQRITKQEWFAKYKMPHEKVAWRFNPRKHKMPSRFPDCY